MLATVGHRVYPRPLSIEGTLGTTPVRLILSTDPNSPAEQKDALVRPVRKDQPFYLFLRNPSEHAREITVRVLANGAQVPGGQATLKLEPGQTQRVDSFSAPAAPGGAAVAPAAPEPPATAEMIPLNAPYRLEVQLEYDGQPAQTHTVPVKLALPTEYLEIADSRFVPTGAAPDGVNRLSVRVVVGNRRKISPRIVREGEARIVLVRMRADTIVARCTGRAIARVIHQNGIAHDIRIERMPRDVSSFP